MYFQPSKEDIDEITDIIAGDPWGSYQDNTLLCGIIHSNSSYVQALMDYKHVQIMPKGKYLEELKERYPCNTKEHGFAYPLTKENVIVHMLEIPLIDIPLYVTSEDYLVSNIAAWRLKKGEYDDS